MINPSFKNIFFFICGIILGIVVLLVSYLALKNSDMDLKGLDNYTGKVTYTGLIRKKASYVFAFRIEKLNQLLGVYDIKQDYSELTNNIKIGDTITVYYQLEILKAII